MLPSRGGTGSQRGASATRKPRGPLGRGSFGKRNPGGNPTTAQAAPKTGGGDAKVSTAAPDGLKWSASSTKSGGASFKNSTFRPNAGTFIPKAASHLKHDDYNGRYTSLKKAREQERKQAIADGFLADPDHPRSLANAITPIGTCLDMCAEFERVERVVQQDVWAPEKTQDKSGPDEASMVKKFRRAAAGLEEQLPSDLRPPHVLKRTIDFLIDDVLRNAQTLASVHYFVWDRTRAVRNDFSIQQVSRPEDLAIAIDCYERIARFHIMSLHQLSGPDKPYDNYDAQQEREQLDKTLLSILQYYDDNRRKISLPNEAEFRSYSIIFQIQTLNPDLEDRMQTWPRELLTNVRVEGALKLYTLVCNASDPQGPFRRWSKPHPIAQSNWAGFWAMIKSGKVSYLMGCVAEIYFPYVRTMALNAILRACKHGGKDRNGRMSANEDWSLQDMELALGLDQEDAIEDLLNQVGLDVGTRADGQRYFDVNTASGKSPLAPVLARSDIVERKRFGRTLAAIVNGLSVRAAHDAGMVEVEEDQESLFLPENHTQSSSQSAAPAGFGSGNGPQNPFGSVQPSSNPFGNPSSTSDQPVPSSLASGSSEWGGFSSAGATTSAQKSAFGSPADGSKKTVHFSEDTKPGPAGGSFPSIFSNPNNPETMQAQPQSSASTTSLFAGFNPPQSGSALPPATTPDDETTKREAAEKATKEQRQADEQAERVREAQTRAAQEQQEARERQAREQEARLQAAKERALQEKIIRERAAQERARQEAEARQAAHQWKLEQERIAKEKQKEEQRALDVVSEQLAFGNGGLFDQFVEYRLAPMIKQAIAQVEHEERMREADWFRSTALSHRYGQMWREICVKRRLQRRGAEKRRRAKRDAQLREEHAKATSIEAELEDFRNRNIAGRGRSESVASSQPSNKENDPEHASYSTEEMQPNKRPRASRRMRSGGLPSPLNPAASQSSELGASLMYNQGDSGMLPPPRRYEDAFGRSTSTFSDSRGSSLNRSVGDIESIRSTYLPSISLASETNGGTHYGQKYDTTRSTYFRLRAMGLDPNSSTLHPERRVPQSDRKRLRTSDVDTLSIVPRKRAQTLSGGSRPTSYSPPAPSSQLLDGNAVTSIEAGPADAADIGEEDDDPIIAMARQARAAMQDGSSLFREASRMLSSTPDRGSGRHYAHQRHQSHSAIVDGPAQFTSNSPRPYRPAVSRFLNRIPKSDRQKYNDAAALELAEEDAKAEAWRKARADKELRDAEDAVEQERLRQSQSGATEIKDEPASTANEVPMGTSAGAVQSATKPAETSTFASPFTASTQPPLSSFGSKTANPPVRSPSIFASYGNGDMKPFGSFSATLNSSSSTTQVLSSVQPIAQTPSPGARTTQTPIPEASFSSFGPASTPSTFGTFGKPAFAPRNVSKDHTLPQAQQQRVLEETTRGARPTQQPTVVAAKTRERPPQPAPRSANMFALLADGDNDDDSDVVDEDEGSDEGDDGSRSQNMDDEVDEEEEDGESVGFSQEEDEVYDEDEEEEESDAEDEAPAPDPAKWQGKGGTSVDDAIEL